MIILLILNRILPLFKLYHLQETSEASKYTLHQKFQKDDFDKKKKTSGSQA
jgi:hypothetical protein